MDSLEMLDVVIGLIFIYILLSMICTTINEYIESFLKLRAVDLEQGIRELLSDHKGEDFVKDIYSHQLINSLFRGTYNTKEIRNKDKTGDDKKKRYSRGSDLPSYIPARNFALALMDILLPANKPKPNKSVKPNENLSDSCTLSGASATLAPYNDNLPERANLPLNPNQLAKLRTSVSSIDNEQVKTALLTIIDAAGDDAAKAREGIENWYNSSMDRVSGWYKRRVQKILLALGFLVAIIINADSLSIFKNLANDRPLRNAIVSQAANFKYTSNDTSATVDKIKKETNALQNMDLPLGWTIKDEKGKSIINSNAVPESDDYLGWLLKIVGWIITGFAISLGAPFWFDLLNKVMVIRSTIKPHEKSQEESSKDLQ